jgi:hypothetical protein
MLPSTNATADMTIKSHPGRKALAGLAGLAIAGGIWMTSATTAVAPDIVRVTADLPNTTGASVAGVYVSSAQPTSVVRLTSSATYFPNGPAAGTPCSTAGLAAGSVTGLSVRVTMSGKMRSCL